VRSESRADSRLFRALSRSLLDRGYSIRFRAGGRSMFPAISDGDIVEVSPQENVSTGDVVLISSDECLLAHRIVASDHGEFVTRGDSCCEDDHTRHAAVLGRISSVVTASGPRAPHTFRTRLRAFFSRLRGDRIFTISG